MKQKAKSKVSVCESCVLETIYETTKGSTIRCGLSMKGYPSKRSCKNHTVDIRVLKEQEIELAMLLKG